MSSRHINNHRMVRGDTGMPPTVVIVVPAYESAGDLEVCLSSIAAQTYDDIETVVVDSNSKDGTREVCRQYDARYIGQESDRVTARRIGTRKTDSTYVFHVDSDMELTSTVVEECVEACEDHADAVVVPEVNVGGTFWAQAWDIEKQLFRETNRGFLRFLPRNLYESVGMHSKGLISKEDEDLHNKVVATGATISCIDSEIKHHVGNVRLFDIVSQKQYYAQNMPDRDISDGDGVAGSSAELTREFLKVVPKIARRRPIAILGYSVILVSTFSLRVKHALLD